MKRTKLLIVCLLAISIILNACQSTPTSTPLSATISELTGKVDLKQASASSFAPASSGAFLDQNGQVQTGDDGRVRLDLSSGTIIRVAPSSLFTLLSNEPVDGGLKTTIKLTLGQLFVVLKGGSTDVQTPSGTATVRGSYMMVQVDPTTGDVTLTCLEGNCSVNSPSGTINFTTGQKIKFTKDPVTGQYTTEGVGPMSEEDYQQWLDENADFKDIVNFAKQQSSSEPTAPPTAPPTSAPTTPPTGGTSGTGGCFGLISPVGDSSLPASGEIPFEWEAQPGAEKYVITFTQPDGSTIAFETTKTNLTHYMESIPAGGEFKWDVTAYGPDGSVLCTAQALTFTKPFTQPFSTLPSGNKRDDKGPAPAATEAATQPPCDPISDPQCPGYPDGY